MKKKTTNIQGKTKLKNKYLLARLYIKRRNKSSSILELE